MKDLTHGSILIHTLTMAVPTAIGALTQIAYQLIDLYFITKLGASATAGVNAAGNAGLVILALMQSLGVGTVALVANAVGREDPADANLVFNQSMALNILSSIAMAALSCILIRVYLNSVAADDAAIEAGSTFTLWLVPAVVSAFMMSTLASALRGTGIVRPSVAFYMLTVVLNSILAPVLIAGLGTGVALGAIGAGLATSISTLAGAVALGMYFRRSQRYLAIDWRLMSPRLDQWARILIVGIPIGVELALTFLTASLVYFAIREFGVAAQAGYGIGSRIIQIVLLPGMSIALAASAIVGQNLGARNISRVLQTFRTSLFLATVVMFVTALLAQWLSKPVVALFIADPSPRAVCLMYLQVMSWAFIPQGIVYTCSSIFQGLGNTVPSLISSGTSFLLFSIPLLWLTSRPHFEVEHVWQLLAASVTLQSIASLLLLRSEYSRRLFPIFYPPQPPGAV